MELEGQAFIYAVYQRFLHRSPDSVGLNHHLELLGSTGDKRNLILSIAGSTEAERACANERRLIAQIERLVNGLGHAQHAPEGLPGPVCGLGS